MKKAIVTLIAEAKKAKAKANEAKTEATAAAAK